MKAVIARLIAAPVLFVMTGCGGRPSVQAPNDRPFGFVDRPRPGERVGRMVDVAGWALDDTSVSKVEIFVDDRLEGSFELTTPRPDVSAAYPQFDRVSAARAHRHGWAATVDLGAVPGPHAIRVRAFDERGAARDLATVAVELIGRE